ncbi:hypothetical protein M9Y10_023941 [Tritrichomonas musculus]|uniref:Bacteriophage/plasmid primase P4 C-terminal domain-containing protein n=1 Tax=Tritrichomonas musculus TaxID=1915356 RepID=A0ABR2KZP3_9EUKA
MDLVYRNILSSFTQERYAPLRKLGITTSEYFPMRNGLLEFTKDGETIFHRDNHDKFMNAYTYVIWEDDYDPNKSDEHKEDHDAILRMIDQIYPIPAEREYAIYVYSSTLHGRGQRDQFFIQYGTGGDGKTTMNIFVNSMLGTDGYGESIQIKKSFI